MKSGPWPQGAAAHVSSRQADWPRVVVVRALIAMMVAGLSACGSGGASLSASAPSSQSTSSESAVGMVSSSSNSSSVVAPEPTATSVDADQRSASDRDEKSAQVLAKLQGDALTLLIADDHALDTPSVQVWTDTAAERGLPLQVLRVKEWLALGSASFEAISGLILPDAALAKASEALVASVDLYARAGGRVMLVHDAMLRNEDGLIAAAQSRMSSMAGVGYAFADAGAEPLHTKAALVARKARLTALDIAPGAYLPFAGSGLPLAVKMASPSSDGRDPVASLLSEPGMPQPTTVPTGKALAATSLVTLAAADSSLAAGLPTPAGLLALYPSYLTDTHYDGVALLANSGGLVAGVRPYGKGRVLFVNLPLGEIKRNQGDARLIDGLMGYFARAEVRLLELSSQQRGVGSLLVATRVAQADTLVEDGAALLSLGAVFQRLPVSLTLAPQARQFLADPEAAALLAQMQQRGAVLAEAADDALTKPKMAVTTAGLAGTSGLQVLASTSSAAAPTDAQLLEWLVELQNFAVQRRVTRGLAADFQILRARHVAVVRPMLDRAEQLIAQGKLAWRTTTEQAMWMQQRQQVRWQVRTREGHSVLQADHPTSLKDLTWLLPKDGYGQPVVQLGAAMVSADATHWIVTAQGGAGIVVQAARKPR